MGRKTKRGVGRNRCFLAQHLVDGKANFDRQAKSLPKLYPIHIRQVASLGIAQLVSDRAMRRYPRAQIMLVEIWSIPTSASRSAATESSRSCVAWARSCLGRERGGQA